MKFAFVVLCVAIATVNAGLTTIVPAATFLRTPQLDSAFITSDRVGANFAYSTVEGHAYQAVAPVFRSAYPLTVTSYNALPVAFPGLHQYVATAAAPFPIISPLAPLSTLQIAGAEAVKTENAESTTATAPPAENKPVQHEEAKADGDSVTVESA